MHDDLEIITEVVELGVSPCLAAERQARANVQIVKCYGDNHAETACAISRLGKPTHYRWVVLQSTAHIALDQARVFDADLILSCEQPAIDDVTEAFAGLSEKPQRIIIGLDIADVMETAQADARNFGFGRAFIFQGLARDAPDDFLANCNSDAVVGIFIVQLEASEDPQARSLVEFDAAISGRLPEGKDITLTIKPDASRTSLILICFGKSVPRKPESSY